MMPRSLHAHSDDSVGIALSALEAGCEEHGVTILEPIAAGHKFALQSIKAGTSVIKLGHSIGLASQDIPAGAHVHEHNLSCTGHANRNVVGIDIRQPAPRMEQYRGYVRPNGKVGTRNFIGILTSVNCSASVAKKIAAYFTYERLTHYPNVDGVIAFSHMSGCGMAKEGRGIDNLRRTITGYALHPNFAAVLLIGLGCEVNQIDPLLDSAEMQRSANLQTLIIQEAGGTSAAIEAGIKAVANMLPAANAATRQNVSAENLTIGLQCGASDGYSALTANPALGVAADILVAAGSKVVLSETPEIYGAEDLLLRRAANPKVAQDLIDRLNWWEHHAARDGASLNNNPSPGNKAGGITTILEKSLGAVAKAGSSPLNAVIDYAETITAAGLSFMDSPGYDPCSATGQIAGGAHMILFTTGRGSVFGSLPAPTLKLASNAALVRQMGADIDVDCSRVLNGTSLDEVGSEIFDRILKTASGMPTVSERLDLGESEWVPWVPGAMY